MNKYNHQVVKPKILADAFKHVQDNGCVHTYIHTCVIGNNNNTHTRTVRCPFCMPRSSHATPHNHTETHTRGRLEVTDDVSMVEMIGLPVRPRPSID